MIPIIQTSAAGHKPADMQKSYPGLQFLFIAALAVTLPGLMSGQNLIGNWPFNGNLNDVSGQNHHIQDKTTSRFVQQDGNLSLALTGRSFAIPNNPAFQTNHFKISYSIWLSAPQLHTPIAAKGNAWQTNLVSGLDSEGRGVEGQSLQFCIAGVCKTSPALAHSPVGRWLRVELSYDGTTATGSADGKPVVTFQGDFAPGNSTADIQLGSFPGSIRDLQIYDVAVVSSPVALVNSVAALGANSIVLGSAATSSSVVLSAPSAWTATANNSFLHLQTGSASGTGGALVVFSVDAFTGTGSRSGTLTIAGLAFTVNQYGTNYQSTSQDVSMSSLLYTSDPYTVAVDGSGSLYVGDNDYHAIIKLATNGVRTALFSNALVTLYLGTYSHTYGNFSGVAVAGDGTVFYTINDHSYTYGTPGYLTAPYPYAGTLRSWDPINGDRATTVSGLSNPQGVAVDASGNVYIADTGHSSIKKWNRTTGTVTTLISGIANHQFSGLVSPTGVAVDLSGNLYIADPGNNSIWMWTAATSQLTALIPFGTLTQPKAVAVDGYGNLFIADTSRTQSAQEDAVKKWTAGTGQLTTLASGGLTPAGVAVDASGNVYVDYYSPSTGTSQIHKLSFGFQQVAPVPSVVSQTQAAASSAITAVGLTVGNVTLALSATIPVGSVISTNPVAGTILALGSTVDLVISMPHAFVPNVVSQTQSAAGAALTGAGLATGTVTLALSATIPVGSVIGTSPAAGTLVTLGSAVNLVVSMPHAYVPDLVSQTRAVATSTLTGVGLTVGTVTFSLSSTVPVGSVISTGPVKGTLVAAGSAVNLVISGQPILVPNVVTQTQSAASTSITGAGLVVGTVSTVNSTTVASGAVISTSPTAGTGVAPGSAVNLIVSLGTVVPNVIGQTQASATSALTAAGLSVGSVTTTVSLTSLSNPGAVISDLVGNVYIADTGNSAIKKWNAATSQLTTLVATGLNAPRGIGLDKSGNVYIADTGNNAIKKWDAVTHQVTTLVSTGLNQPQGIVVDRYLAGPYDPLGSNQIQSRGDVYIADTGNNAIKVWTASTQQVTTLVSTGLNQPAGIGYSIGGSIYIADTGNNAIKKYSSNLLTTVVSTGLNGPTAVVCSAYTDNATDFFNDPTTAVVDFIPFEDLYIADTGNNAIKWSSHYNQSDLYTVASGLNHPSGVASDGKDTVWIADSGNSGLQKITSLCGAIDHGGCNLSFPTPSTLLRSVAPGTILTTIAAPGATVNVGSAVNLTIEAGPVALNANSLLAPSAGGSSSVYLTYRDAPSPWSANSNDSFLHVAAANISGNASASIAFTIDAFTGTGIRSGTLTIAGLTFTVTQVGANYAATSQSKAPISGGFNLPNGVAVDGTGNLYIADTANNVIKKWSVSTQQVTTLVVGGLSSPNVVAVDGNGNLYIGDSASLQMWNAATQQLSVLVSQLNSVNGVAVDPSGNVFFTTVVPAYGLNEWNAATMQATVLVSSGFSNARAIALDSAGNVYIGDAANNALKMWSATTQQVTTLAGTGLLGPWGVAVDSFTGDVYFSDSRNSAIKQWSAATQQVTTLVTGSPVGITNRYRGLALDASGNLYFAQTDGNLIGSLSKAYVAVGSLSEPNTAGTDSLPPVIPLTTTLTGSSAPTSDQPWLTVASVTNGVVNFSYAANITGSPRTGHITTMGVQFTVNQGLQVAVPNVIGQTQAAATTTITGAGLIVGTVATASSATVTAGSVISTNPTTATQVNVGSTVNLVVSTGPAQVAVPNVVGQTQDAATTAITGAGLVVGTVTTASSSTVTAGNVISTNPVAATQVILGSAVSLVISTGPAQVAVPNVVGQTQAAATTAITGAGLVVGTVTTASSSTVTAGSVISTSPAAATQVNLGSAVNLVVSTGPAQVAVPNVIGQTQAAAMTAVTGAGLVVGTVTTASSSSVTAGNVISTNPAATTQVNLGSAVSLVISTGPAQVTVPNVVGQTQAGATTAITGAGLVVGTVTSASSSSVTAGSVISTNPAATTQVNLGSAVSLVISTGPAQVAVPNVIGQTQAAATTSVTSAGLVVGTVTTASSSTVTAGSVISTNPAATTQVNLGSAVSLVISTGAAQVAVPNVVGQTQATATTVIAGAGLIVGTVTTASSSTVIAGAVISTSPTAATQVNPGSAVNLVISTGPAQVPALDLTSQVTITRGAAIFSRVTGRYTQSITLSNSGAALPATAFVLDNLATGYALYQSSGFTSAAAPASSPFQEIGVVGAGANVTFTLELTRTGTPALTYTPRILGPGAR